MLTPCPKRASPARREAAFFAPILRVNLLPSYEVRVFDEQRSSAATRVRMASSVERGFPAEVDANAVEVSLQVLADGFEYEDSDAPTTLT